MGYSISWVGFRGASKAAVLPLTGLVDTGKLDDANESPISAAELPTGWYLLFLNDFTHSFVSANSLARLSADGMVLACQVEEHVMVSVATCYERGAHCWTVTHDSAQGIYDLEVTGTPPEFFAQLRAQQVQSQQNDDAEQAGVDHLFDVPLELAARLCGYRHDQWKFDWGEPVFTQLEPVKK